MIEAIVYTSGTGYTRQYAALLSELTGLPARELGGMTARKDAEVIYLGWLSAGQIVGLAKARKLLRVPCVCAVGISPESEELEHKLRRNNKVLGEDRLFYLQGGLDLTKLNPAVRTVMKAICASTQKKLLAKGTLTPSEQATLKMTRGTYSAVCTENVRKVADWYAAHK